MKYECNDKYRELEVLGIKTNDYNCKTIYQLKRNAVRDSLMHILSKTSYWEPAANDVNGRINSSISYNYNYLRYDSCIKFEQYSSFFYGIEEKIPHVFTKSGMSGISAVIMWVISKGKSIKFINKPYFETSRLYSLLFRKAAKDNDNIKYCDTTDILGVNFDKVISEAEDAKLLIFDTTMYSREELTDFVKKLYATTIPLVLIRSHSKLDMMGYEYGNLGSIAFMNCEETFIKEIKELLSFGGGLAYPSDIPFFWDGQESSLLNDLRCRRIVKNNSSLYESLMSKGIKGKIVLPAHKKYITIQFDACNDFYVLKDSIVNGIKNTGISDYVLYLETFGSDYMTIDAYDILENGGSLVRISSGDLSENAFSLVSEKISEMIFAMSLKFSE